MQRGFNTFSSDFASSSASPSVPASYTASRQPSHPPLRSHIASGCALDATAYHQYPSGYGVSAAPAQHPVYPPVGAGPSFPPYPAAQPYNAPHPYAAQPIQGYPVYNSYYPPATPAPYPAPHPYHASAHTSSSYSYDNHQRQQREVEVRDQLYQERLQHQRIAAAQAQAQIQAFVERGQSLPPARHQSTPVQTSTSTPTDKRTQSPAVPNLKIDTDRPFPSAPVSTTPTYSPVAPPTPTLSASFLTPSTVLTELGPGAPGQDEEVSYDTSLLWKRIQDRMATSEDAWASYAGVYTIVGAMRLDTLKDAIRGINGRLGRGKALKLSGRKEELVNRVRSELAEAKRSGDLEYYNVLRQGLANADADRISYGHRYGSAYLAGVPSSVLSGSGPAASTSTTGAAASGSGSGPPPAAYDPPNRAPAPTFHLGDKSLTNGNASASGSGSSVNRPAPSGSDPAAPYKPASPNKPHFYNGATGSGTFAPASAPSQKRFPMTFAASPFYRFEDNVSGVAVCQKAGQGDRRSVSLQISLTSEQRTKLSTARVDPSAPQYQLRFYCTSEDHYSGSIPAYHGRASKPAPTEYPLTCEVKLNDITVPGNTRGIKKQPGTAPPPDLGKAKSSSRGHALNLVGGYNRVEFVYVNIEKKHYCIVFLVEYTSVSKLMGKLEKGKVKSKDEVLALIKKGGEDDDVVMSSSALDLRDPLSMCRIAVPVRSTICSHLQCFDARTFLEVMEATPTWKCPVCSRVLSMDKLFVDGYMQDILKAAPSSIDSVVIEADGTWRDENNKYGTAATVRAPSNRPLAVAVEGTGASSLPSPAPTSSDDKGKRKASGDVVMLDDDDDDDLPLTRPPLKRAKTEISVSSSPVRGSASAPVVIDLTDDD